MLETAEDTFLVQMYTRLSGQETWKDFPKIKDQGVMVIRLPFPSSSCTLTFSV